MPVQKKRNLWYARADFWQDGKRRCICIPGSFQTRAEAVAALAVTKAARNNASQRARLERFLNAVTGYSPQDTGMLISSAWTAYLGTTQGKATERRQRMNKLCEWKRFTAWLAKKYPEAVLLKHVTRQMAFAYCADIAKEGVKGKTANNRRCKVSSIFQALLVPADLPLNPFHGFAMQSTEDSERGEAFTPDEQVRIFSALPPMLKDACTVAKYTGLRFRDVARLDAGQIRQTDVGACIFAMPAKTRRHKIEVCIPVHRRIAGIVTGKAGEIFPELAAISRKKNPNDYELGKVLETLGIAGKGWHSWRHTFRTDLERAKVPREIAERLTGHSSGKVSERYNHDLTRLREAIDALA